MRVVSFVAGSILVAGGWPGVAVAQNPAPAQPPAQQPAAAMSFFVTSAGTGDGANLGGLAGAAAHCAALAAASGTPIAPNRTWHAYLSATGPDGRPIHARDRIGAGPWHNAKGAMINGAGDTPNVHDILTGSDSEGRALPGRMDTTCENWTSNSATGSAMVGHHDRTGGGTTSWNSAHPSRGCGQQNLVSTGGAGLLYCFGAN